MLRRFEDISSAEKSDENRQISAPEDKDKQDEPEEQDEATEEEPLLTSDNNRDCNPRYHTETETETETEEEGDTKMFFISNFLQ